MHVWGGWWPFRLRKMNNQTSRFGICVACNMLNARWQMLLVQWSVGLSWRVQWWWSTSHAVTNIVTIALKCRPNQVACQTVVVFFFSWKRSGHQSQFIQCEKQLQLISGNPIPHARFTHHCTLTFWQPCSIAHTYHNTRSGHCINIAWVTRGSADWPSPSHYVGLGSMELNAERDQ